MALAIAAMPAIGAHAQSAELPPSVANASANSTHDQGNDYILGSGDKIHIDVFGQSDLTGDYVVDGSGNVQIPLIGQVKAAGSTVADFQKAVAAKFADGYLVNPSLSVTVANYRPFYIIGQVGKPGEYPYVNGMSILNAVALAGGYTFQADDTEVYIRRNGSNKEVQFPADATTKISPGDIIRVPERFF